MRAPAAKQGDRVTAVDTHIVMVPSSSGEVPTPMPLPFAGALAGGLSANVSIMGKPAAVVGSTADNAPRHLPAPPGTRFQKEPSNQATILSGSASVRINGKAAARNGDPARTCNDPADLPVGTVLATGTVRIG